jgi:anthranilate synthase component 1
VAPREKPLAPFTGERFLFNGEKMLYLPDKDTFCREAEKANLVPVFRELPGDLETPVSAFLKLQGNSPCFLLESVERGEQLGRYSFIGTNPSLTLKASLLQAEVVRQGKSEFISLNQGQDALHLVQELLSQHRVAAASGLPRFFGGAVGYMSYDMVRCFERLPEPDRDELDLPDCLFLFTDTLVIFDHVRHRIQVISNARIHGEASLAYEEAVAKIDALIDALSRRLIQATSQVSKSCQAGLESNFTPEQFCTAVKAAKEFIAAGDIFQVVLAQRLHRRTSAKPFSIYRALRMLNPSPYMFYLDFGAFQLIGSSPEMLVKSEEGKAETRPIAGTRPRGKSEAEDKALIEQLLADPKERAEHVMLVDLGRNDLGRVCRYSTVKVPLYMSIEKYSHVIHIVSSVLGDLMEGQDAFGLLRAAFPAGTVSGAPKIRAMEIINELERLKRGPYAGAVGYFSFNGNMDTCITIRTIVMKGDSVYLQAGAGIVADSEPIVEYYETLSKIGALEQAVSLAEEAERPVEVKNGR